MNETDRVAAGLIDWTLATLLGGAAGWSLLASGHPGWALAGAAAALGLALAAMTVASRGAARYRLPRFALPDWPELIAVPEPLLLDQPLPDTVVRLRPGTRALPTAGELDARIQAHLTQRPAGGAEIIALRPDATAALREALAGLKHARP